MNKDALIAEWVGTHYGHNFDAMGESEKRHWRSRYFHMIDDGFGRHTFTTEEVIAEAEDNAELRAQRDTLLKAALGLLADPYLHDPINNDRMAATRAAVKLIYKE